MNLRILSLGAGVQSSTLALMIERGELPMVTAGIFADTQAESKETNSKEGKSGSPSEGQHKDHRESPAI